MNKNLVKDSSGKAYQKTLTFGNRNTKNPFRNRKKYRRQDNKQNMD